MYIMVRDNGGNMNSFNKNKHFTACNSGQMLKQVQHDNDNCLAESLDESGTSPTFAEHNNFRSQFLSSHTKMPLQKRGIWHSNTDQQLSPKNIIETTIDKLIKMINNVIKNKIMYNYEDLIKEAA